MTINGLKWRVIYDYIDDEGLTTFAALTITINKQLKDRKLDEELERTVIHEVVHAYLYSYGIPCESMNEEQVCEFIACNLENIMKYSKEALKELKNGSK